MPRSFDHAVLRFAREADVAGKTDQCGYYLVHIGRELWFEMSVIRTWIGTLCACFYCVVSLSGRAHLVVVVGNRIAAGRDLEKQEK